MKNENIVVVPKDSLIYNACDAKGFETGVSGKPPHPVPCLYSVYEIKDGLAYYQQKNRWGIVSFGVIQLSKLEKYGLLRGVKVILENGDDFFTSINGSNSSIRQYYVGRTLNIGDGPEDKMVRVRDVEFLD